MQKEGKQKKTRRRNPTASNLVCTYAKVEQFELKEKSEKEPEIPIPATEYTDYYTEYQEVHEHNDTSDTESLQSFSSSIPGGIDDNQNIEIDEEVSNQYSFISKLEPIQMCSKETCQQLQFDEYEEE